MFLRNAWYVAAWDSELGEKPLGRTFLGEQVVLYRRADGTAVALADRCCHRGLPLALGRVEGDCLRCGYHGLVFDPSGACVEVPGQSRIPPDASVRAYPLVERWHLVWIWMGDPARADASSIPDWWFLDHPEWKLVPGNRAKPLSTRCNYEMVVDNLLDLSHLTFVHTSTIGNDEIVRFPVRTEREADRVRMTRLMPAVAPPPFYKMAGRFAGNVDRWQIVEGILPCHVDVDVGCTEVGLGAMDGKRNQGTAFHSVQNPTPETEHTCHFFYGHARRFSLDDPAMDEIYRRDFLNVFIEDVTIMEAQQRILDQSPDFAPVDINVDAPCLAMRRMLRERIAAEAAETKSAAAE
jgi:vanillate O-demethylase monooxygenase subunit